MKNQFPLPPPQIAVAVAAVVKPLSEQSARPEEVKLFQVVEDISPVLWQDLESRSPEAVALNSGANYAEGRGFSLVYMGGEYLVDCSQRAIVAPPGHKPPDFQKALTLLSYLTLAQDFGSSGRQVTGRELNGGEMFFKGPHAFLTEPVTSKFGREPDAFLSKAALLGFATEVKDGAWTCQGLVLPHLGMGLYFHPEDDEFPAELTYTFDSYAHYHLPLDGVWAMVNALAAELAFG